jgi:serine/threonine protein kinase
MLQKNVLVSRAGRVMLADFGISRVSVTLETTVMAAGGTCHWMAPEMLLNLGSQRPEKESDIWALGCTFYEVN